MAADLPPEQLPLLDRFKWVILAITVLAILAVFAYLLLQQNEPVTITINLPAPTETHTPTLTPIPTETPAPLEIYVTGEVNEPESRLTMPVGSRVEDAIEAAGGATDNADLSVVNLVQVLRDGDQVHVPALASDPDQDESSEAPTPTPNQPRLIDLNTATQIELEALPGIGPSTAGAIIEYRDENGEFETVEDIMNVPGIGEGTFEELRPLITVE